MASTQTNKTVFAGKKFLRRYFEYQMNPKKSELPKLEQAARLFSKVIDFNIDKYNVGGISGGKKKVSTRGKSVRTKTSGRRYDS